MDIGQPLRDISDSFDVFEILILVLGRLLGE
jgi:hypothetical protein